MKVFTTVVFSAFVTGCFLACCCPSGSSQSLNGAVEERRAAAEEAEAEKEREESERQEAEQSRLAKEAADKKMELEQLGITLPENATKEELAWYDKLAAAKRTLATPAPELPAKPIAEQDEAEAKRYMREIVAYEAAIVRRGKAQAVIDEHSAMLIEFEREHAVAAEAAYRPRKIDAWVMSQDFVKKFLKSPSTANFGSIFGESQAPNDCTKYLGKGEYEVRGWVDSQNAFGATVRSDFLLKLRDNGDGKWSLIGVPIIETR